MTKKIIVFDKDDTITKAKCNIENNMAKLLSKLSFKYDIAIITWWSFENIYEQIVRLLPTSTDFSRLYLFPTIWAQMYIFKNSKWEKVYWDFLSEKEVNYITEVLNVAIEKLNLKPKKTWWDIIENRWPQITYSALWQQAPLEAKKTFDPDKKIRKKIVDFIKEKLSDYSIWIWGSTSIDITRKWLNKAYWIQKIMENLNFKKEDILFIWDALFKWGNDYPVKELWIDCIQVSSLDDTEKEIRNLLNN